MQNCKLDRVDLIKIDVEGHEEQVLASLAPVINEHRPRVIVFEHFNDLHNSNVFIRRFMDNYSL